MCPNEAAFAVYFFFLYTLISGKFCCQQRGGAAVGCVCVPRLKTGCGAHISSVCVCGCVTRGIQSHRKGVLSSKPTDMDEEGKETLTMGGCNLHTLAWSPGAAATSKMLDSCSQSAEMTERRSSRMEEEQDFIMQQQDCTFSEVCVCVALLQSFVR